MNLTFAGELTKMIESGLGRESAAPDTGVAVGRYSEYIEVSDAAIATFDTNAALPLRALSVNIEPIQDLHGQDVPYPGGGNKNKLPMTVDALKAVNSSRTWTGNSCDVNGVTVTILTDADNNVIGLNLNGTCSISSSFYIMSSASMTFTDDTILNGISGGSNSTFRLRINAEYIDTGSGITIPANTTITQCDIRINATTSLSNVKIYPMIRLASVSDATFAPYSNICPITGRSEVKVWREATYDTSADPALTVQLGQTVYGGTVDATSGTLTVTMANIASYDGETLPGKWISDRDVYAPDTTPTTGAQVVYELAEPVEVELTPQQLETLIGTNNVWSDGGNVSLTYTKYNYTEGY